MQLVPIPQSNVAASASIWGPFVERIALNIGVPSAGIIHDAVAGRLILIVIWDEEAQEPVALIGCAVVPFGDKQVGEVRYLTGKGRERWVHLLPELERYLIEHQGCSRIRMIHRPGWKKTLEAGGYNTTHMVSEKDA